MRLLSRIVLAAATLHALAAGALFGIMWLPPGQFAAIAAHIPGPVMLRLLPFQRAWSIARAGSLSVGDAAPAFQLPRHGNSGRASFGGRAARPVVLIFGSYT